MVCSGGLTGKVTCEPRPEDTEGMEGLLSETGAFQARGAASAKALRQEPMVGIPGIVIGEAGREESGGGEGKDNR
jgi:hypothetical protein